MSCHAVDTGHVRSETLWVDRVRPIIVWIRSVDISFLLLFYFFFFLPFTCTKVRHGKLFTSSLNTAYNRAANRYGISVFCTEFTCKIREYEFGLQNTEIELCQFCHIKYCCQNKAYLFWVANQSRFVAFYALTPSNTSLITKTFNLLSSTCSSSTFSCLTSCSCSTETIH